MASRTRRAARDAARGGAAPRRRSPMPRAGRARRSARTRARRPQRRVAQPGGELARVEDRRRRCDPRRRRCRWGRRPRRASPPRRARSRRGRSAPAARGSSSSHGSLVGVGEREQLAGGLEVAVDAVARRGRRASAVEVLQPEPLEHRPSRSAKRASPFSIPCVSDATQKPPLRPRAPKPAVSASSSDDVARRVERLRVQRRPQPGEAAADDAQVGVGHARQRGRRAPARSRSQNGCGSASANAARCAAVGGVVGQGTSELGRALRSPVASVNAAREPQQRRLAAVAPDELEPDRQPVAA